MPLPIAGAAIGAGAELLGAGINAASQGRQNKKNREFSEKMYEKQKADNYVAWQAQNEYNSPKAQMARFQEAGLNPNLIYGQGNSGNAGAVSTPDVQTPQTRAPEWGGAVSAVGSGFSKFYNLKIQQAQLDNMEAQNTVLHQEALLKASQTRATDAAADMGEYKFDFESNLAQTSADLRREQLRQTTVNIDNSVQENIRRAATVGATVQEIGERILNMRAERNLIPYKARQYDASTAESYQRIQNMIKDGTLRQMDIDLRKEGIMPNDPMYARIAIRQLNNATGDNGTIIDRLKKWWQDF